MRIALIGDLQYRVGTEDEIRLFLSQIEAEKPDFAVSMGDMGCGGEIGTPVGMQRCREFLDILSCPKAVLMGNHDVEYMPVNGTAPEQMQWYSQVFEREHPWQALTIGNVLLLCISVEQQPVAGHITRHALYISDEQYNWVRDQIQTHGDAPVIICSHAPAPGSGLRCYPPIHVAAVDDYIDHTFDALRWRRLIREFPQIRLWCSAHFHMGHDYLGAMCLEENLLHVSCGVLTTAARDDTRQTRILDVTNSEVRISTLLHREGVLRHDTTLSLDTCKKPAGQILPAERYSTFLGPDEAEHVWLWESVQKIYIATKEGFLWEYDMNLKNLVGAIMQKHHVQIAACADDRLYWQDEDGVHSVCIHDRQRFDIRDGHLPTHVVSSDAMPTCNLQELSFTFDTLPEGTYLRFEM